MLYFCCFLEVGQAAHSVRTAKNQKRILFRADRMHRLSNNQKTAKASQNCPSELTIISVKATLSDAIRVLCLPESRKLCMGDGRLRSVSWGKSVAAGTYSVLGKKCAESTFHLYE